MSAMRPLASFAYVPDIHYSALTDPREQKAAPTVCSSESFFCQGHLSLHNRVSARPGGRGLVKLWKLPNTIHSSPKSHLIHAMRGTCRCAFLSLLVFASTSYLREYSPSREALFPLLDEQGERPLDLIFRVLHVSVLPSVPWPAPHGFNHKLGYRGNRRTDDPVNGIQKGFRSIPQSIIMLECSRVYFAMTWATKTQGCTMLIF